MTEDTIIQERKPTKKFLRDFYATKLLRDKDSKDYLIVIITSALKISINKIMTLKYNRENVRYCLLFSNRVRKSL